MLPCNIKNCLSLNLSGSSDLFLNLCHRQYMFIEQKKNIIFPNEFT